MFYKERIEKISDYIRSNKKLLFFIVIGCIYVFMFILNYLTPHLADDFVYSGSKNILEVFKNEYYQYMHWGGRSVVHSIARTFLMLPKIWFNLINPLVYILLTLLIYIFSTSKEKELSITRYIFINILIWLFMPRYGQTILWLVGASNYLWGTTIILSFLVPYYCFIVFDKFNNKNKLMPVFMLILGVIAGWCNENTSGGSVLLVIAFLLISYIYKKQITLWMITGLFGNIIGLAVMIFSPGNNSRANQVEDLPFLSKIATNLIAVSENIKNDSMPLIIIFLILFIITLFTNKDKLMNVFSAVFTLASLATLYVLVLSPVGIGQGGRSFFGGTIFLIIACSQCFSINLLEKKRGTTLVPIILLSILFFQIIISVPLGFIDIYRNSFLLKERNNYVISQKEQSNINPTVSLIDPQPRTKYPASAGLEDLNNNDSNWINKPYAKRFNIETVRSVSRNDWDRIYKNGNPELMNILSLEQYLSKLNEKEYFVVFSGYGNLESLFSENEKVLYDKLGLESNLLKDDSSYIGVIDNGNKIVEQASNEFLEFTLDVSEQKITIDASMGFYDNQNFSKIIFNDYDYSKNRPGLNIVVFDKNEGKIIDRIIFETVNDEVVGNR
ncbi:DUF3329 domain-containing protein [Carnobacterium inhibens]|uniref:DUF3329 domain-containing protein n=1 Tax=Carnobacterium inhibens TaxID=147709 RepID=UPI00203B41A5|nr:DUF6056 family protein [Carnobacterium inhibens]MCM3511409.1 DUF6056 family protein [Carnobacterium inhibens]